jgi:hypothetical protein
MHHIYIGVIIMNKEVAKNIIVDLVTSIQGYKATELITHLPDSIIMNLDLDILCI